MYLSPKEFTRLILTFVSFSIVLESLKVVMDSLL